MTDKDLNPEHGVPVRNHIRKILQLERGGVGVQLVDKLRMCQLLFAETLRFLLRLGLPDLRLEILNVLH